MELGSHQLKVDGSAQPSLKDVHDALTVDCVGKPPAYQASLLHVAHTSGIVAVSVVALVFPRAADPGVVL